MIDYEMNKEAIDKVCEIDEQIKDEYGKEVADKGKITKLMFEKLLRGLYINQF
jgi:hypothetical protein